MKPLNAKTQRRKGAARISTKGKHIVDVCCGPRRFWFDKAHPETIYLDSRVLVHLPKNKRDRVCIVKPDHVADFRKPPLPSGKFSLVVFDPPQMHITGKNGYMLRQWGTLTKDWKNDIAEGFKQCFRILKPLGVLVFKWAEYHHPVAEILKLTPIPPLFGNRCGKQNRTHWLVFMKPVARKS